jgi:hypothetical protein
MPAAYLHIRARMYVTQNIFCISVVAPEKKVRELLLYETLVLYLCLQEPAFGPFNAIRIKFTSSVY